MYMCSDCYSGWVCMSVVSAHGKHELYLHAIKGLEHFMNDSHDNTIGFGIITLAFIIDFTS